MRGSWVNVTMVIGSRGLKRVRTGWTGAGTTGPEHFNFAEAEFVRAALSEHVDGRTGFSVSEPNEKRFGSPSFRSGREIPEVVKVVIYRKEMIVRFDFIRVNVIRNWTAIG